MSMAKLVVQNRNTRRTRRLLLDGTKASKILDTITFQYADRHPRQSRHQSQRAYRSMAAADVARSRPLYLGAFTPKPEHHLQPSQRLSKCQSKHGSAFSIVATRIFTVEQSNMLSLLINGAYTPSAQPSQERTLTRRQCPSNRLGPLATTLPSPSAKAALGSTLPDKLCWTSS
ncbi:uncharacterized protein UBRO_06851 [Ustilago bromivora]|uniref:Uncharacterized protein n=1 Tax=Ustilago bromivora TaxID=307758 RepID=A0A1K0G8V8_9BASI|nr:uncharacterized protein UBRO_06851 [Ustilago bromivora]